jgi:hypothetical protein
MAWEETIPATLSVYTVPEGVFGVEIHAMAGGGAGGWSEVVSSTVP